MAMRAGEMMVIIRAQDFASRTLRRVGGEFAHLSREQQKQFRKQAIAWQKYDAQASVSAAKERMRQLGIAQDYRNTTKALDKNVAQRAHLLKQMSRAEAFVAREFDQARTRGGGRIPGPTAMSSIRPAAIRAVEQYKQQITELEKASEPLVKKQNKLTHAMANYAPWVGRAAMNQGAYFDALSRTNRGLVEAYRNLSQAKQAQLAFDQAMARMPINRMQEMAHVLGGVGRTMQLFGAVGTVALGAAANTAANFNTEISLAATQARDLDAPVAQVQKRIDQLTNGFSKNGKEMKGVLSLMNQFPADQSAMAAGAYDIFSSMNLLDGKVTDVAAGLDLLATANKIAIAGGEELDIATNAMITTFNNFDPKLENTTETLDTMFDIIRFGRMRLGDFNTMMNKIAPAAAGAGLSLRDVGGAMAFLTEVMPSQRMVATGISRLIEALNHPDVRKGLKMYGVQVRKVTGEMRPLDDIMKDIAKQFPKLAKGQMTAAEMFKMVSQKGRGGGVGVMFTAEGRKALTQIITHLDEYLDRQRQIDENKGEFGASYEAQLKSLGVQWGIFMNRMKAVIVAIGTDAIPVFAELGQVLKRLLDWWQGLDPELRKTIVRMAVMASVATLLVGAVFALSGALLGSAAMLARFGMGLGGVAGFMAKLTKGVRYLGALGAISIIINVKRKGNAGAWDFLMAAMSGAAMGAGFGPWGALAGAAVMTVIVAVQDQMGQDKTMNEGIAKMLEENSKQQHPAARAYGRYLAAEIRAGAKSVMSQDEYFQFFKTFQKKGNAVGRTEDNRAALNRANTTKANKDLKNSTDDLSEAQKRYNKARDIWEKKDKKYTEALREHKNAMREHVRAVKEYHEQLAKATVQARQEVVDNLRGMYMEIQQVNEQLMGTLFQGPLLGGEAFDLAKEWGITANIDAMTKDINQATALFNKIQKGFAKLRKIGIAPEMISEIQKMEPNDALGFIQGILKGTPKQQQALIAAFKKRNEAVQSQTKMDFVDEIERFRKAGVDMGEAIKNGFQQAEVGAWFDNWVQRTFPDVISSAVNTAVAQWQTENPMPKAPKPPIRPVRPTAPPDQAAAPGTTVNDNSETNLNFYLGGHARNAAEEREDMRKIGFIVKNAMGGPAGNRSRSIGKPNTINRTRGMK